MRTAEVDTALYTAGNPVRSTYSGFCDEDDVDVATWFHLPREDGLYVHSRSADVPNNFYLPMGRTKIFLCRGWFVYSVVKPRATSRRWALLFRVRLVGLASRSHRSPGRVPSFFFAPEVPTDVG